MQKLIHILIFLEQNITYLDHLLPFYLFRQVAHTHSRFTALLEFVRDHPGEQVPERYKPWR